jgi:hypothetical protein
LGIPVFFLILSCKHQQPIEDTPPEETAPAVPAAPAADTDTPDQASLDALSASIDRVNNLRKLVRDFNGPGYFPQEFEAAESLYSAATQNEKKSTLNEARESTNRYAAAAEAFAALADKTLPRYAEEKEKEILSTRQAALDGGIKSWGSEYLEQADDKALEARAYYESRDYYPAGDSAETALAMYRVINTGLNAYKTRIAVMDRGFYDYDPQTMDQADQTGLEALGDYNAGNIPSSADKTEEALLKYTLVLKKGIALFAAENAAAAERARQEALNQKANVAVRQDFDAANVVYQNAAAAYRKEQYEEATPLYMDAAERFEDLIEVVAEKRQRAADALQEAELKMLESDGTARQAELIIEGGR